MEDGRALPIKKSALKKLFVYIDGYWNDTIITWVSVFIESVLEVLVAFFMQYLIDDVKSNDINGIYLYSAVIASLAILAAVSGIISAHYAASAASGFGKNLREAMFVKIQSFSFKNIDKFSTSSIVTRTTTDVSNAQNSFLQIVRAVIRAPFLMVFALIMCFVTEWRLAWIFLVIIPVILVVLLFIAAKVHPIFVKVFNEYDNLNQVVEENVDGVRVVKSFDREEEQKKKFGGVSDFIYRNFVKAEKRLAFNNPILNLAVYGAIIAIAFFGGKLIVDSGEKDFTVGGLTTLITYVMMIMNSLMMISMVYVTIIISRNSVERILELIEEKSDIVSPINAITTIENGDVVFRDVNFAYSGDKYVLSDINLSFKRGQVVGIIGSTGSGKSSLMSLIARLYDTTSGEVIVGGHNVKDYDLVSLRDKVAVVLQKNTLFTGTIRDNLKWGDEEASDEALYKVLEVAQAADFVHGFKDGLDHQLDEGGTNLSGGQKQRLCIARALLKNPKILILDDSTSACDTHTDALIREQLTNERKDVTKFIISQRILSIKDCDDIIVLDKGKVVAEGTSEALLKSCSVYKELYVSQLSGGDFDAKN